MSNGSTGTVYAPYIPINLPSNNKVYVDGILQYKKFTKTEFRSVLRDKFVHILERDYPWFLEYVSKSKWLNGECPLQYASQIEEVCSYEYGFDEDLLGFDITQMITDHYPLYRNDGYYHSDNTKNMVAKDFRIESHVFFICLLRLLKEHEDLVKFKVL